MVGLVRIISMVQFNAYSLEAETSIPLCTLAIDGNPTVTYIIVLGLLAGGYA